MFIILDGEPGTITPEKEEAYGYFQQQLQLVAFNFQVQSSKGEKHLQVKRVGNAKNPVSHGSDWVAHHCPFRVKQGCMQLILRLGLYGPLCLDLCKIQRIYLIVHHGQPTCIMTI